MLRGIEGFDHFNSTTLGSLKGWNIGGTIGSGGWNVSFASGRINGQAFRGSADVGNGTAYFTRVFSVAAGTFILGIAYNNNVLPGSTITIAQFKNGGVNGTLIGSICLTSTGKFNIKNKSQASVVTGSATYVPGTWTYLEIKIVIGGVSGTCATQVNGIADIGTTTGDFGVVAFDTVLLILDNSPFGQNIQMFDDIYYCDAMGSANKDFLGDVHVETIYPSSDGTHSDWTPNSGVTHYNRVNENPPDNDTTYNSTATIGNIDSYNYTDLSILGNVFGVQTNLWARKDDATARQVKAIIRTGGSDYTPGASQTLSTSYADYTDIFETNPSAVSGTLWTVADINAAEFGVKVVT